MGEDEVSLEHRAALRSAGIPVNASGGQPIIGIANTASDLNPCNLAAKGLVGSVKVGIASRGGVGVEFPVMSLGEDLMKPTAMLYRSLLAIEIEETLRSYPLDGVVLLAGCDKTIPGALMGAVSADLPTLVVPLGSRESSMWRGTELGAGTALWRIWDERRTGQLNDEEWREVEECLTCGWGTCNTMGTASTMAILSEVLGFTLPRTATMFVSDPAVSLAAERSGQRIVEMVFGDVKPSRVCTDTSLSNAIKVLNAIGGSTNAVIHIAAIARRLGLHFTIDDVDSLGREIPLLVDVQPSGAQLIQKFHAAGGVPTLARSLGPLLDGSPILADGRTLEEVAKEAPEPSGVIRTGNEPLAVGGAFRVVRGSLAPDGAVIRRSTASSRLLTHRGRALVFRDYAEMLRRVEDPTIAVDENNILVLSGYGPVGLPGMPEWGMLPIPRKLLLSGVSDMLRISDARMSGTAFGTVVLHVAPEAAVGGPLALVEDGDEIALDADAGILDLCVPRERLAERRDEWRPRPPRHVRGWPALFAAHVRQAPDGCDLDFLESPTLAHRVFVEPMIGRS